MEKRHDIMVSVDTALKRIVESASHLGEETVSLFDAAGRILYDDVKSNVDIPPFNNSAMDGYALRYADTAGATPGNKVEFFVKGEIQAGGGSLTQGVGRNTAIRIMTGAPIPEGADSVIPVELTEEIVANDSIRISKALKQHENIRFAGEDIKKGQVVLKKGKKLLSADIGLLAALNRPNINVYKRPRVAIISTGDELAEVGDDLLPGKIRNSNAYTLYSEVTKYNGIPSYLGIAKDTVENIKNTFARALDFDIVISTGGVSMGKYDFVKDVLSELGVNIVIEKLKMKPGKPMIFGSKGATLFFGLPGNPVSTIVSFIEFVRPALLKMSGAEDLNKPELLAVADNDIRKISGRKEFIRGSFYIQNGTIHVTTTGPQGSGLLRSMSIANCLIVMPEESEGCSQGQSVIIQLIHHEEIP
jgi:molybdopterin molybdotransferase